MARIKRREKNGPGLLFIILTLVVVAVVGAKVFDLSPDVAEERQLPSAPRGDEGNIPNRQPAADGAPKVLVVHSYATGNYQPKQDSHQEGGEPGDVVGIGHELMQALEMRGVKVIHDTTVHDKPRFSEAFINSGKTVGNILRDNSSIQMVLDVNRDGLQDKPENYTTVKVNGKEVAKILFVVGDKNNNQINANLAFAQKLSDSLEAKYPGVTRGVRILQADYNGTLHPNSVRIIIGDWKGNTLAQATESAKLLAEVIAGLVQ